VAKAILGREAPVREPPPAERVYELAVRLQELAEAQDVARRAANDLEPNCSAAFERLFAAVARLNPLHAASEIMKWVQPQA
jgi:hypothetical protein